MCNKSESIAQLAIALVKFNGEVSKVSKDASNPFFKNNYATLDNIIDEVRPILQKHGLSIMQMPGGTGENVIMKTLIIHESGEWIESEPLIMKPVKNDPQSVGSCITYARRYSLAAILSLNTGEDDDGNKASSTGEKGTQTTGTTAPLKAKYEVWHGSKDGYEAWYESQKSKFNDKQIEHWLQGQIQKKKESA